MYNNRACKEYSLQYCKEYIIFAILQRNALTEKRYTEAIYENFKGHSPTRNHLTEI